MIKRLIALLLVLCLSAPAATHYYDPNAGDDTRTSLQSQSKATPWKHLPGMANATSNAASYAPVAGDQLILKGGESWPNASFPITWTRSGTNGNPIYIGVDLTWFTGGAWTQPKFDAGGVAITGSFNEFVRQFSTTDVTWENIEMTGLFWNTNYANAALNCMVLAGGQRITLSKMYWHGWTHGALGANGLTEDDFKCIYGDTNSPYMSGSVITDSICDGTGGGQSGNCTYAWPSVKRSVFHDVPNALLILGSGEVAYNLIYNIVLDFDGINHANCLETLGGLNPTIYIHDNVFHDCAGEAAFLGNAGETDYVWNNLWYNLTENSPELVQNVTAGSAAYFWNNTIVAPPGQNCLLQGHTATTPILEFRNNHCITTAAAAVSPGILCTTCTLTPNVLQTPTVATAQGYTAAQTPYAYFPTAGGATIGAGVNLTTSWPVGFSTNDTTYACTLGAGNQVSCPARTSVPRSITWDAGTFQLSGLSASPTSLTFNPQALSTTSSGQAITITNNSGATITLTSELLQTGTNYSIFSNTCGGSLVNTASCVVTIKFTPLSAGTLTDNLVITSSGDGSPQSVPLSGIGLATPVISPATGSYSGAQTVTITDATSGVSIYYTLDGTTPDNTKTLYSGAFLVSTTRTVKAIAILSGVSSGIDTSVLTITGTNNNLTTMVNHVVLNHVVIN